MPGDFYYVFRYMWSFICLNMQYIFLFKYKNNANNFQPSSFLGPQIVTANIWHISLQIFQCIHKHVFIFKNIRVGS